MKKLHLLYCLIFSFLIAGAGIWTARSQQEIIIQALFFPVPLFFAVAFIKELGKR